MFIINANPSNDDSVHNDSVTKVQSDCAEIMQLCSLPIITTSYLNERQIVESEELAHSDIFGVVNLKYRISNRADRTNPFTPIYSNVNNDRHTVRMIDIFCKVLNRSYGSNGYVSARNVWFEQYDVPRAICVNLASCNLEAEFQREVQQYGERIAIALIAFLEYLLPSSIPLINSKCKEFFGEKSNYLDNKYPFEL